MEYIALTYAVWRSGACVVPIPVELAAIEKQRIVEEIHLHAVVSPERDASFIEAYSRGEWVELSSTHSLKRVDGPQPAPAAFAGVNSAFIRFTSGTTGDSKGVVLSHETIRDRIYAANDALELTEADRVVWLLSMSYHFAVSIVGYLTFGCTIILPQGVFAPAILQAAEEHAGTFIYGSPLQYSWMVNCDSDAALDGLRLAISTTSGLNENLGREFEQRFGLPLTQALGIIEVGLPCINVDFASMQPEAVGRVLPAYEMKLRETGLGAEANEILLRGPGFLDAYYRPWRTREEITQDGWFATGDVASVDENGCVQIQGRSKDVINISGMKFFPQEVESVLCEHPGVRAARVFSFVHPRWGELAQAQVVADAEAGPTPAVGELSAWCKARLAPFKIPTDIEYVDEFPRTASGKVLHRAPRRAGGR